MKIEVLPVALIPSTLSDKIKKSETMLERVFSKLFPSCKKPLSAAKKGTNSPG